MKRGCSCPCGSLQTGPPCPRPLRPLIAPTGRSAMCTWMLLVVMVMVMLMHLVTGA